MIKKIIIIFVVFNACASLQLLAQTDAKKVAEANAIATGNYKDVFNSFFQLAFDKLTSKNKEINFTSNPYAVMAKLDTNLLLDDEYYRYRHLRRLNFSVAAKLDSNYKFNGFSSGIKYALINRRDETVSEAFRNEVLQQDLVQELFVVNNALAGFASTFTDSAKQISVQADITNFTRGNQNFADLDNDLKQRIRTIIETNNLNTLSSILKSDSTFNIRNSTQALYNEIKKTYNNKLLWTIGVNDTTYNDQFMFSNIVFFSELLKGVVRKSSVCNVELNLLSTLQITDDTLLAGRDLSRSVFNFEPGVNLVLKAAGTEKSYLEFKLSGAFRHTFSKLYINEKRDNLTLNGTLRIRVLDDIWLPVEVKYDPKTGNVFGFLTVKANFTGLGKLLSR